MKRLNSLLFTLCSLVSTHTAYAGETCQEIKTEIMAQEHSISTSPLNACTDITQSNCCKADEPETCLTMSQMESNYNSTLSKIILIDSLISLGAIVEEKHELIKEIPVSEIKKADENINDFFYNLNKSELVSKSLKLSKNTSYIWKGFSGSSSTMTQWIDLKCKNAVNKSFCDSYKRVYKESTQKQKQDLNDSLYGLAKTTQYATDNHIKKSFENYQSYLKVQINGKELNYDELQESSHLKDIKELKNLFAEYRKAPSIDLSKRISQKKNTLNSLSVNFNKDYQNQFEGRLSEYNDSNISESMSKLKYALDGYSGISAVNKNLTQASTLLTSESERIGKILEIKAKVFFSNSSLKCDSEDYYDCLKELNGKVKNAEREEVQALVVEFDKNAELKNLKEISNGTKACTKDDDKTIKSCHEQLNKKLSKMLANDTLESLKKKLKDEKGIIKYAQKGQPFVRKNFNLAYSLDMYKKRCTHPTEINIDAPISICRTAEIEQAKYTALELGSDVDKIIINMTYNKYLNDGKLLSTDETEALTEAFLNDCETEKEENNPVCLAHFSMVTENNREIANIRKREANARKLINSKIKTNKLDQQKLEFARVQEKQAITQTVAAGGMQLLGGLFEFDQMNRTHQQRLNYYEQDLKKKRYWNNYYQENPIYTYQNVPGYPHTYTDDYTPYSQRPSFAGQDTDIMFYDSYNFSSTSFVSPRMYTPFNDNSLDVNYGGPSF